MLCLTLYSNLQINYKSDEDIMQIGRTRDPQTPLNTRRKNPFKGKIY